MASLFFRASSKRISLSPCVRQATLSRFVSTTSNKKAEVNTESEPAFQQQLPPASVISKTNYYEAVGPNSLPNETATSRDPLHHVLDHPSASIILRDACKCNKCKDHGTSQRDFNLANIPADIKPSAVEQDVQGNLVVQWQNDMPGWETHVSIFTPQQIERLKTWMHNEHRLSTCLWDRKGFEKNRFSVTYDEYMNSDVALAKTIFYFARYGVVFIEKVPEDEHAVKRLAQRIASMKSTFYGETWDIKSVPNATNVAFTNKYLGFHGDLMYLKEPPTVQYLHCIHNSCAGGESRFIDQFKVLDTLYSEDRGLAGALARIKLRYEYENDGYFYSDVKPIVEWRKDSYAFPRRTIRGADNDEMNHVYRTFWGPQFLGSIISDFGVSDSAMKNSLAAMKKYTEIMERDDLVYEEKMIPGTCVMFDNLRVLHARNEFDMNTGKRWLKGTYVDGQDLWSLEMKLKNHMTELELEGS